MERQIPLRGPAKKPRVGRRGAHTGECAMNGVTDGRLVGSSDPIGRPTDDPEET